jgi:hypothetical protein
MTPDSPLARRLLLFVRSEDRNDAARDSLQRFAGLEHVAIAAEPHRSLLNIRNRRPKRQDRQHLGFVEVAKNSRYILRRFHTTALRPRSPPVINAPR